MRLDNFKYGQRCPICKDRKYTYEYVKPRKAIDDHIDDLH